MLASSLAVATEVWIAVVAAGGALLGALIGGAISHWSQSAHRREERLHQHNERLRTAYASWAGALRGRVELECRQLKINREVSQNIEAFQSDKELALQIGMDIRDVSLAALDASANEEMAFCKVMLTDTNKGRRRRAQGIRNMSPNDIALRTGPDPTLRLKALRMLYQGKVTLYLYF